MIRQQANKENVILLNARSELSLMVLPKLSLVRYQDLGPDQGKEIEQGNHKKSTEIAPNSIPFNSNNNEDSKAKVKLKFFDVENKRTTAKKSNGGGNRSITFNKNYKQTKISDMMTRST